MKDKLFMIAFVLVLGSVWTTALVGVDRWTSPIIEKHTRAKLRSSILTALGIPFESNRSEQVFDANVEISEKDGLKIYRSKQGAVAFNISGSGVQGSISGVMALEDDLKTIKGITIVAQEETPGLGDRVFEEETLSRFAGKVVLPELLVMSPGKASRDNEVDGVTSATLTCQAFQKILNSEVKKYMSAIKGDSR